MEDELTNRQHYFGRVTKALPQTVTHLTDQPAGPVVLCHRLGTRPRRPALRGVGVTGGSHCPSSHCGSTCHPAENTEPHHAWGRVTYGDPRRDVPLGWVGDSAPLGEGGLLSLHPGPAVLIHTGPTETHRARNGSRAVRRVDAGGPGLHIAPSPAPATGGASGQRVRHAPPDQAVSQSCSRSDS